MAPRLALATCSEVPELDPEGQLLLGACRDAGIDTEAAIWDEGDIDWEGFDLVVLRSTWDYKDKPAEFRAWTSRVGRRLRNTPEIVSWNLSKHYLDVLRGWGFPIVPTQFLEPGACHEEIAGALPAAGEFVVKPAVSAGSTDTARYVADDADDRERAAGHARDLIGAGRTVMVQPFIASVETEAETAVVLLGGEPVHAIRKGPLLDVGQGLEQGLFREEDISLRQAHQDELRLAQSIVERFAAEVAPPLYARVDMLRDDAGKPTVLELELIEPSLTLDFSPSSLARMVELLGAELGTAR
jgi:hypothetical protein